MIRIWPWLNLRRIDLDKGCQRQLVHYLRLLRLGMGRSRLEAAEMVLRTSVKRCTKEEKS